MRIWLPAAFAFCAFSLGSLPIEHSHARTPEACVEDLSDIAEPVTSLIQRNKQIAIMRVTKIVDVPDEIWIGDNVSFELEIRGVLKGAFDGKTFRLQGVRTDAAALRAAERAAIERHKDLGTFAYRMFGGSTKLHRRKNAVTCEYVPSLLEGAHYLVFPNAPYAPKSFEPISDFANDSWYHSVQQEAGMQEDLSRIIPRQH